MEYEELEVPITYEGIMHTIHLYIGYGKRSIGINELESHIKDVYYTVVNKELINFLLELQSVNVIRHPGSNSLAYYTMVSTKSLDKIAKFIVANLELTYEQKWAYSNSTVEVSFDPNIHSASAQVFITTLKSASKEAEAILTLAGL